MTFLPIPKPPPTWWRRFHAVYLSVVLIVGVVGFSGQGSPQYLIFSAAMGLLLLGFAVLTTYLPAAKAGDEDL